MSTNPPEALAREAQLAAEQAAALLHYAVEASARLLTATRALARAEDGALAEALRAVGAAEDLLGRARSRVSAASEALAERCLVVGDRS